MKIIGEKPEIKITLTIENGQITNMELKTNNALFETPFANPYSLIN